MNIINNFWTKTKNFFTDTDKKELEELKKTELQKETEAINYINENMKYKVVDDKVEFSVERKGEKHTEAVDKEIIERAEANNNLNLLIHRVHRNLKYSLLMNEELELEKK